MLTYASEQIVLKVNSQKSCARPSSTLLAHVDLTVLARQLVAMRFIVSIEPLDTINA